MALPDLQEVCSEIEAGTPDDVIERLRMLVDTAPGYAAAYVVLAQAYEAAGDHERAFQTWQQVAFLIPNSPAAREGMARVQVAPSPAPSPDEPKEALLWDDGDTHAAIPVVSLDTDAHTPLEDEPKEDPDSLSQASSSFAFHHAIEEALTTPGSDSPPSPEAQDALWGDEVIDMLGWEADDTDDQPETIPSEAPEAVQEDELVQEEAEREAPVSLPDLLADQPSSLFFVDEPIPAGPLDEEPPPVHDTELLPEAALPPESPPEEAVSDTTFDLVTEEDLATPPAFDLIPQDLPKEVVDRDDHLVMNQAPDVPALPETPVVEEEEDHTLPVGEEASLDTLPDLSTEPEASPPQEAASPPAEILELPSWETPSSWMPLGADDLSAMLADDTEPAAEAVQAPPAEEAAPPEDTPPPPIHWHALSEVDDLTPEEPPPAPPTPDEAPAAPAPSSTPSMRIPLGAARHQAAPPPPPPDDDLDRLIEELESARIVPNVDFETTPAPDLDDDIDDMVSETLAIIYMTQQQHSEAARVYEKLADQKPDRAGEFLQQALHLYEKLARDQPDQAGAYQQKAEALRARIAG